MTDDSRRDDVLEDDAASARSGANGPVPDENVITPDDIESELENLHRDLAKTNDRYMRLAAEFDNYRKRVERERSELYTKAQADLARKLLEVVDDLERVAHFDESTPAKALLEGVQLVEKKMVQVLESFGLEAVDAEGAVFDPATMEGIATAEAEHPEEDEVVADVFQPGYRFKGQLLRPARVRVKKFEA
ncbi:MAG: nucleotide exchange factor GrpE [Longimicrobiales bacterium]